MLACMYANGAPRHSLAAAKSERSRRRCKVGSPHVLRKALDGIDVGVSAHEALLDRKALRGGGAHAIVAIARVLDVFDGHPARVQLRVAPVHVRVDRAEGGLADVDFVDALRKLKDVCGGGARVACERK